MYRQLSGAGYTCIYVATQLDDTSLRQFRLHIAAILYRFRSPTSRLLKSALACDGVAELFKDAQELL